MRRCLVPTFLVLIACGSRSELGALAGGADATEAAPPTAGCPGAPAEPVLLASLGRPEAYENVTAMAVARGHLYYAVSDGSNNPVAIFRVPVGGGDATPVVKGFGGCDVTSPFAYGNLDTDGRYLFTPDEEGVGCTAYPVRVTAYDVTSGELSQLPTPPGADVEPRALSPRALPHGGAAWLIDPGTYTGPVVVARWSGGAESSVVAALPAWGTGLVMAGGVGFASTIASGVVTLHELSMADGTVTARGTFGVDFAFVGANDEAIFYTPDRSTFARREVATGAVTALAIPVPVRATWADHDDVYVDSFGRTPTTFPAVVTRVPARGGAPVEIYRDDARSGIQAITGDACNVYFAAGPDYDARRPAAVFARRR